MSDPLRLRYRLYGLAVLGAVALLIALAVASYAQAFTRFTSITVDSGRAGLLLDTSDDVKFHGVTIGAVGRILPAQGESGVRLVLDLDNDQARMVPADAVATITPTTAFGRKQVLLAPPAGGGSIVPIADGATIPAQAVTVEVESVLDQVNSLLNTLNAAQLNATLTALSQSLDGRGADLGATVDQLADYLRKINPSMPALRGDLHATAAVTNLYADVSPALLRLLRNLTFTSHTLVDERDDLGGFFREVTGVSDSGVHLLDANGEDLSNLLDVLRPSTGVVGRFAPQLTCLVEGLDYLRPYLEVAQGGVGPSGRVLGRPGINTMTKFLQGKDPYKYPNDLFTPSNNPPSCYGLPRLGPGQIPQARAQTHTGYEPRAATPHLGNPSVSQYFLGPLATPATPGSGK
jgi:phospholipid/cholesterol/gamma-HCH transport system substrate-binding protein